MQIVHITYPPLCKYHSLKTRQALVYAFYLAVRLRRSLGQGLDPVESRCRYV